MIPDSPTGLLLLLLVLPAAAPRAQEAGSAVDFTRDVAPLLKAHCIRCHGEKRGLGKLRLHRRDRVFDAAGASKVIVPGRPEESEFYRRLVLPEGDKKRMPRKKPPLGEAELATFRQWIEQGAVWPEARSEGPPLPVLDASGRAARDAAMARLSQRGAAVRRLGDSDAVQVNLGVLGGRLRASDLEALQGLAPALVRLDLARAPLDDAMSAKLPTLPVLRRLDLGGTKIGDATLAALAASPQLEWLNLYGTGITDAGLQQIASLERLRRLFLWNTAVTDAGVARFAAARPKCAIDRGGHHRVLERVRAATAPVNRSCPIMKKPVVDAFTFEDEGRVVGFCCEKCLTTYRRDPAKHREKVVTDG